MSQNPVSSSDGTVKRDVDSGPLGQRVDRSYVEVVPDVGVLVSEWDDLAERMNCSPFMRPGWISAWLEAFGAGVPRLVTVRRSAGLAGVLPMHLKHGRLRSTSNWHSPGFDPLAADERAREALLGGLFSQPTPKHRAEAA